MQIIVIIAVTIYLIALFIFANALSEKKSNRNLNSVSSNINNKTNEDDDFPKGFIEFSKNNINETNRYKIKNNVYE